MKSRNTKQKEIIEYQIENTEAFFTAEDLYKKIIKIDKKIGIATIYRFLKNLKKRNLIHSYNCNKKIIYSKTKRSHCHFICKKCKKTSHLEINNLNFIKNKINKNICHFQLDIYGICEKCSNRDERLSQP
jgi:Fur family ferric uptake transcriptional regulator